MFQEELLYLFLLGTFVDGYPVDYFDAVIQENYLLARMRRACKT
jgi:hypothetical protein